MVVKVFCGEEFSEHEHEWNQFNEVYSLICEQYAKSDEVIYILSNFLLSNAQIDVAILTGKGPAILELKSYKGEIRGSENGDWKVITENGNEVQLPVNLFQQLKTQKFAFLEKLNLIQTGNFEQIESKKLARIKCWGYFEKGSTYDVSQVGGGVHMWFDVITANELIEKLRFVDARYLLRPKDMDAIVRGLKLTECAGMEPIEIKPVVSHDASKEIFKQRPSSEKIESLLKIDNFQWVKRDLLPLFGLLNLIEEEGNGFFTLPLSKENLIANLERITGKHRSIIVRDLLQFEETFKEYIEIKNNSYTYRTDNTTKSHPPSTNPCPNPRDSTEYYILKPELAELAEEELKKISINPQIIFKDILSNVRTIEDLMYLVLLTKVSQTCKSWNLFSFGLPESGKVEPLRTAMEIANIDEEVIEYCFSWSFEFELTLDKFENFSPSNNKIIALFYSHKFNTSSCRRHINITMRSDLAQYLYKKLDRIDIEKILEDNYGKIKQHLMEQEERLPLFEYQNEHLKFVEEHYSKLTSSEPLYTFVFENYFNKSIDYLKNKDIIGIRDDELILLSEDKLRVFRNELREMELKRIDKNKKELLLKWLRSGVKIQ